MDPLYDGMVMQSTPYSKRAVALPRQWLKVGFAMRVIFGDKLVINVIYTCSVYDYRKFGLLVIDVAKYDNRTKECSDSRK